MAPTGLGNPSPHNGNDATRPRVKSAGVRVQSSDSNDFLLWAQGQTHCENTGAAAVAPCPGGCGRGRIVSLDSASVSSLHKVRADKRM